jgi:hypothetical protein
MMKRIFCLVLLGINGILYGQKDEVIVITHGTRKIEPAYRMTSLPNIIDTVISTKVAEFPLLVLQQKTAISVEPIKPANISTTSLLPTLYNSYAKIGIGSELMPLGELYVNSKWNSKYIWGIHAKHLSSFGNFTNYAPAQFDRTKVDLNGAYIRPKYSLKSALHYNNQGLHYYGWQIPTDSIDRKEIAQRYHDAGGLFSYQSHKADSATFNYGVTADYNYFTNQKTYLDTNGDWRARENNVGVQFFGKYSNGKEIISGELAVRNNRYNYGSPGDTNFIAADTGFVYNNTLVTLKPKITTLLKDNRFKAELGVDLSVEAAEKAKFYVFPLIELKYALFDNIFIPYAGLRGGIKQNSLKALVNQNEFILTNQELRNENTAIDFYAGIKGVLSKNISFNASASFARVKDKAFFITDTLFSVGNKFRAIYDTLNLTTIEASLTYQLNDKIKIDGVGRYFSYALLNNSFAWNLPDWQGIIRGHYNILDKLIFNLDFNLEGGRKALVYENGDDIIEENNQFAKNLGVIADINLGAEYRLEKKRLSVFIQFNNIASQSYQRWYNYPVQRFQVMGGITARF